MNDWPELFRDSQAALQLHYRPAMERAAEEIGVSLQNLRVIWLSMIYDPDPISTSVIQHQTPYTNAEIFLQRFETAAERGWLSPLPGDMYQITSQGRAAVESVLNAAYESMAGLTPLSNSDLMQVRIYLWRLVERCLQMDMPSIKYNLLMSRRGDPGAQVAEIVRIEQHLTDLNAFRDDAHLAAWDSYRVNAPTWEVFTLLWRGDVSNLDEVCKNLAARGHQRSTYTAALQGLVRRGWVMEVGGDYKVTRNGETIRSAAEASTDRYYYGPWDALAANEQDYLWTSLARMGDILRSIVK
jgi:hypothetical protein